MRFVINQCVAGCARVNSGDFCGGNVKDGLGVGLIWLTPFFLYNFVNFGSPLSIAHFHHRTFLYNHSVQTIFDWTKAPKQAYDVLFDGVKFTSLFGSSPYLAIGAFGILPLIRNQHRIGLLSLSLTICSLIPGVAFAGDSGYDLDYRQIIFCLPFWAVFLGSAVNWLCQTVAWKNLLVRFSVVFLLVLSVVVASKKHFAHIRHAYQAQMGDVFINLSAVANVAPIIFVIGFILVLIHVRSWSSLCENSAPR